MIVRLAILTAVAATLVLGLVNPPQPVVAASEHGETHTGHGGGAAGEPNLNPLDFKTDLALWTGVLFLLVMAILWKFAWGPIRDGLDKREQSIADQIAQAEAANEQARELLAVYEQKLETAKDEVREILANGRHDAEQVGRELIEKAKVGAEAERQRALREIDAATVTALKELADRSATLAVDLAGKIVSSKLSAADHTRLIEQAMSNFAREPSSN